MLTGKRHSKLMPLVLLLALSLLLAGCSTSISKPANQSADAKNLASKFPTKDIILIVPVAPGGGFDTLARAIAPYLKKNLPNNPNVIIKNVEGGEWAMGINQIMQAKPDGYTIGIFNIPGNVVTQITGTANYDLSKIVWLGSITTAPYVGAISPASKYKTLDDMKKASQILVGTTGLASTSGIGVIVGMQEMGIKPKFVVSSGSSESYLAAMRGDVDYVQQAYGSIKEYIESKKLTPLLVFSKDRIASLPDVPTVAELGYPALADLVSVYYMLGATPGTPPEVAKILRDAFDKAVVDPDFQKKIDQTGNFRNPMNATEAEAMIQSSLDKFPKYKDLVKQYMK